MTVDPTTIQLTEEEQNYEKIFSEKNTIRATPEEIAAFAQVAKNTMKRKSITIRPFERDVMMIQAIAAAEGMPYQTKIVTILRKYVNDYRSGNIT